MYCTCLVESTYSSAGPTEVSHIAGADYAMGASMESFHMNRVLIGVDNVFYVGAAPGHKTCPRASAWPIRSG